MPITNNAPVAVYDDPVDGGLSTDEDNPFTTVDLRWNDSDPDGNAITVINVEGALVGEDIMLTGSGAIIRLNADGTVFYNTNNQFDGLSAGEIYYDSFSYTISDGELTSTATVSIAVNGLEDPGDGGGGGEDFPPSATDDIGPEFTTDEDTTFITLPLQANDFDPENFPLTVISVNGSGPGFEQLLNSGAMLTLNDDGTVTYNPNHAFDHLGDGDVYIDEIFYTVSDGLNEASAKATIKILGVTDHISTDGNDTVQGSDVNDAINGLAGDDKMYAKEGEDWLSGDEGNDYLDGGAGNDTLLGGTGSDHLVGGTGGDSLNGGDGTDKLYGGAGDDSLVGGAGFDRLYGEAGNDRLNGEAGNDSLSGGDGVDFLRGGAGNDTLAGDAGNDDLNGDAGNDVISGGAGLDKIRGGAGVDNLTGGLSADRFIFAEGDSNVAHQDLITDFQIGTDLIDLTAIAGSTVFFGGAGTQDVTITNDINTFSLHVHTTVVWDGVAQLSIF